MITEQVALPFIQQRHADIQRLLSEASVTRLWLDYERRIEKGFECFSQACDVLSRHLPDKALTDGRVWSESIALALRALPGVGKSVMQYQKDFGSILRSARHFWKEAEALDDHELLALLALKESHGAVNDFVRLLAQFDRFADEEGIGIREDLKEAALRVERATWERLEAAYAGRNLDRAIELLAAARLSAARFEPRPATQIIREVASMNGRKGGKTKPTDPVKNFALERYKEKRWPSARKASFELRDEVFNFSKSVGIRLSDDNLQTTMHRWFLRYDKDTQSGN